MDSYTQAKLQNIINEVENYLIKDHTDDLVSKILLRASLSQIKTLLSHIGYLEAKLESTIDSNRTLALHADNIIAENQRLSQIAKY